MTEALPAAARIVTPDERLRVFISSHPVLTDERDAAIGAVRMLRLLPVVFEAGARIHPSREVYRSYVEQSDIFIGVYGDNTSANPDAEVPLLQDQFDASHGKPRLIYVKDLPNVSPAMESFVADIASHADVSYRRFRSAPELGELIADDLAVLLTERFSGRMDASTTVTTQPRPILPATPTSFVDRTGEMERVVELLRDPMVRLVTICGPGGVGKTRLALEAGSRVADDFPDGAVIVWLDSLNDPSVVLQAMAAELHVKETAGRSLLTAIGDHLRGLRMLIVLDNFEHVISAAARLADVVALPTASKFLVTTRELLNVRGEQTVQVDALPLPDEHGASPATLNESDAVRLFVDRASARAPGFTLDEENARDIADIVRRLEGLPLAIELAAARVRVLPPHALLQRLTRLLDLPAGGVRDIPARQRTLRETIAWSYRLLDDTERSALERLSVFRGEASLRAAAAVIDEVAQDDTIGVLDSLLRKSLLRTTDTGNDEPRVAMLAAIREFAAEQLEHHGDGPAARDRHAEYFTTFTAENAQRMHSAEQARCLAALDADLENLQAALEWLFSQERGDEALTLANHLRWYWALRGHLTAADGWMRRLLDLPSLSDTVLGPGLTTAGMIALEMGDHRRARHLFERAVDVTARLHDADAMAWATTGLGAVLAAAGEHAEAQGLQQQALDIFRNEDDLLGQCTANTRIAVLSLADGDYAAADERFKTSLQVRRKIRDPWGTSYVLTELGFVRLLADDYKAAEQYLHEALELVREIDYRDGIARVLTGLGTIDAANGSWEGAAKKFEEAARLYWIVGNRAGRALALALSTRAAIDVGDPDDPGEPARRASEAFALAADIADARAAVAALESLVCTAATVGKAAEAALLAGAAERIRVAHGVPASRYNPLGPGAFLAQVEEALGKEQFAEVVERGRSLSNQEVETLVARVAAAVHHSATQDADGTGRVMPGR